MIKSLSRPIENSQIKEFQRIILKFWQSNGRKKLPWRTTCDPWKVLIAETLLRKTTSQQVEAVYNKLAELSPRQIADMNLDEIAMVIKPLGLYRLRAKQINEMAKAVNNNGCEILKQESMLNQLPGVGKYICNAVLCFAFKYPRPTVDTNVIRVIQRVFGMKSLKSRPREDTELWKFAEILIPEGNCREFNWGMLDFANSICTARKPKCYQCQLVEICSYNKGAVNV